MTTDDPAEPKGISPKGKAPKTRFSTPGGVYSAYSTEKSKQSKANDRLADIRDAYDRMPPLLSKEEEEALNGFPNINRGEFRSKIDVYLATWTDHNTGGERIAEVRCKKHGYTETEQHEYSVKCTKYFNEALQQWEFEEGPSLAPYILESVVRDTQMALFGIGPIWFRDTTDWRFASVPNRCVVVPGGTKVNLRNCPIMWIEDSKTATELYDLRDRDGWNEKAVLDFLHKKINPQVNGQLEDRAAWQHRISLNLDLGGQEFTPFTIIHAYVQEFNDGREKNGISHYVVTEADSQEFLYKKEREYNSYGHVMVAFCDSAGAEGDWHGVRGFGDLCFDLCHLNDKFFNHIARVGVMSSLPWWQGGSESDRQKLSQIRLSLMGVCTDLELKQNRIEGDISGCIEILAESSRTLNQNSRIFPQNDTKAGTIGEKATATQVAFDRQDEAKFNGLQIKFYRIVCIDRQLSEQYRRLTAPADKYPESLPGGKAAAEFRKKCKEGGVPEKCYRDVEYVRCSRSGGSGNMALDVQKANSVLSIATPGPGQLNARKEIAAAEYGWERVKEFVEDEPVPDNIDVVVGLENGMINLGQVVQAFPNQDHQRHLGTPDQNGTGHLAVLNATREGAMQLQEVGIENALDDAMKLVRTMEAVHAHCDRHAGFLETEQKFKESAKIIRGIVDSFGQFLTTFQQAVGDAMKAAQPQGPQLSAEDQAKLMKAQIDAQIKEAFAQQELAHRQQAHDQKLGNVAERSTAKEMLTDSQHVQKLGREAELHETKKLREQAEAAEAQARTRAQGNLQSVTNGAK